MVKNPPAMQETWGRSPREGNGNPLQYPCLGNPINREAWHVFKGSQKSDMTERLNNNQQQHTHTYVVAV